MCNYEGEFLFEGNYISVEEYPTGCVIYDKDRDSAVTIGDLEDINLVIARLERLKKVWYGDGDEQV